MQLSPTDSPVGAVDEVEEESEEATQLVAEKSVVEIHDPPSHQPVAVEPPQPRIRQPIPVAEVLEEPSSEEMAVTQIDIMPIAAKEEGLRRTENHSWRIPSATDRPRTSTHKPPYTRDLLLAAGGAFLGVLVLGLLYQWIF